MLQGGIVATHIFRSLELFANIFLGQKNIVTMILVKIMLIIYLLNLQQAEVRGGGGGTLHMKRVGMLVASLRGVNFGFWSRLGCSG